MEFFHLRRYYTGPLFNIALLIEGKLNNHSTSVRISFSSILRNSIKGHYLV